MADVGAGNDMPVEQGMRKHIVEAFMGATGLGHIDAEMVDDQNAEGSGQQN